MSARISSFLLLTFWLGISACQAPDEPAPATGPSIIVFLLDAASSLEEELLRGLEGLPPAESPGSQRSGY